MKSRHRGFTIIELLVVVVLIAVMLAIAVPSLASFVANYRVTTATNDFLQGITMTRIEALKRGRFVDMIPKTPGDWKSGWRIIVETTPANHTWDAGEEIIFEHDPLPSTITTSFPSSPASGNFTDSGGNVYIAFDGTGYPREHFLSGTPLVGGIVMVDHSAPTVTSMHVLCMASFGRPRVFTAASGPTDCTN